MKIIWNLIARNRNYRLLLSAGLISLCGDWVFSIGMSFHVFAVTGSTLAAGAIVFTALLPHFLLGTVGGVFADRWDRRTAMIYANVALGVTLLPMLFMSGTGQLWIVYVTVAAQNSISQLFSSVEAAFVPTVVGKEDLVAANSLNGQNQQIARLVGSALVGVIAATGGIMAVTAVNLVSYVVAALLIAAIRTGVAADEPPSAEGGSAIWREWIDGIRLCGREPDLSALLTYQVLSRFGEGVLSALFAPFVIGVVHANAAQFGAVNGIQAIGGIVGGLTIAALAARVRPAELLGHGALVFGVLALLFALHPLVLSGVWPAMALIAVIGVPIAAVNAGFFTLLQLRSPEVYRGRVFGTINAAGAASMIVGTVVGSTLPATFGVIAVISLQGIVHIVAGPLVLARLRRVLPDEPAAVAVAAKAGP